MLRRTPVVAAMLRRTFVALNYYPFGHQRPPRAEHSNTPGKKDMRPVQQRTEMPRKQRNELELRCKQCRFRWENSTLRVDCPRYEEHNQREVWLDDHWIRFRRQPRHMWTQLGQPTNPRTGETGGSEMKRGKNKNVERRSVGLTSHARAITKDRIGMSQRVSGVGHHSQRWRVHFPYPS